MTTIHPSATATPTTDASPSSASRIPPDTSPPVGAPPASVPESSIGASARDDLIRQAAYRRYLERGEEPGREVEDWIAAEAEINQSSVE